MKLSHFISRLQKLLGTKPQRRRHVTVGARLESLEVRTLMSGEALIATVPGVATVDRQRLEIQYDQNDNPVESRINVAGVEFWLDPISSALVITGTTSADSLEWFDGVSDLPGDWMIHVSNERGSGDVLIQGGSLTSLTVFAGAGNDRVDLTDLFASPEFVSVYGQAGDDYLNGLPVEGGLLDGGDGNDFLWAHVTKSVSTLNGGTGDDRILGGSGPNIINGGSGNDSLEGSYGNDTINGGEGNDRVFGMWGDNLIHGDGGNDFIEAAEGNDTIFGDAGNDLLGGGGGNDYLSGGYDQDAIRGGAGNDSLYGGAGDDQLFGGAGSDFLSGDDGTDALFAGGYSDLWSPGKLQIVRDSAGLVSNFQFDETKLIESLSMDRDVLYGGIGNDWLIGGSGREILAGEDGDDLLFGGGNNDELYGGRGNDCMRAGTGDDLLSGESGMDYLRGESGNDKIYAGAGNDFLYGGTGDDRLYGGSGSNKFDGGTGQDVTNSSETIQGPSTPPRPIQV